VRDAPNRLFSKSDIITEPNEGAGGSSKRPRPRAVSRATIDDSDGTREGDANLDESGMGASGDGLSSKKRKDKLVAVEVEGRQAKLRRLAVGIAKSREALAGVVEALDALEELAKAIV